MAGERPAHGRSVHRECHHAETLQPVPVDNRPVRPGDGIHHERIQGPQDHQDEFPRRLVPKEPRIGAAFRQSAARPGRGELRSDPEPRAEQGAEEDGRTCADHVGRSGYRFVAFVRHILVDEGSHGRVPAGYMFEGDVRQLHCDEELAAEPMSESGVESREA